MRTGIMIGSDRLPRTVDDIIQLVSAAENAGLDSAWMANIFGFRRHHEHDFGGARHKEN